MDEENAPSGEHADHDGAEQREVEDPNTIDVNVHATLANINKNMGQMAIILEKMYNASAETAGEPSQGKLRVTTQNRGDKGVTTPSQSPTGKHGVITRNHSPTGRKRKTSASESESSDQESAHGSRHKRKRPNHSDADAEISIHASDSWDEEDDIRQLTKRNEKGLSKSQPSLLDDLAQSLDDDEVPGEKIDTKLADIAQKRWGKKLKTEKLKDILDKYKRPENCQTLTNTKVNPEIWAKLSKEKKGNDLQLQYIQQTLLKATLATLQTANALIQTDAKGDLSKLITQSVDSIAMLGHASAQVSQFRKHQIKPALKSEYSAICETEEHPDSKFLFGDDLAKNMKDAKEASQIGHAFKGATKSFSKNKQSYGDMNYDRKNYRYTPKPFLGKRQYQNHPKKKNSWPGHQRK